jgi:hypothetical protein
MSQPPSDSPNETPSDKSQVELYQQLVLEYEKLDHQIDALLMRNHGRTEDMSDEDYLEYRELADRRDEIHNQIQALESALLDDETDDQA